MTSTQNDALPRSIRSAHRRVDQEFRMRTHRLLATFLLACLPAGSAFAPLDCLSLRAAEVPPPAPPILHRGVSASTETSGPALRIKTLSGLTLYSIGNPTDEEQLYVEYINRARLDPAAEARRLRASTDPDILRNYKGADVDLDLMVSQFAQLSPAPPLSINAQLTAAARGHSADMLAHGFQGHESSDGTAFDARITASGYSWNAVGENVFSYVHSVEEGHAGFEVDWGGDATTGGMQDPPHHRLNIHSTDFRELGIGVAHGTNGEFGPGFLTQDFGSRPGLTPFITGVAYYDLNGNGQYDLGEGLGGATVRAAGSGFYAVSANSGGYSLPVAGPGSYTVTFSVPGAADAPVPVQVPGNANVKLDRRLPYVPVAVSGPGALGIQQTGSYTASPLAGAVGYDSRQDLLTPAPANVGAENGTNGVTAVTSSGYPVVDPRIRNTGESSFHLAQPNVSGSGPETQSLILNGVLLARSTTRLVFASRLSWASPNQVAHAQVSVDGGQTWQDVWSQAGTGDAGEMIFTARNIPLGTFDGREIQVRFTYDYSGGSYFPQSDAGVGFYLDDITVQDANTIVAGPVQDLGSGNSFNFTPSQVGSYSLRARVKLPGRALPWGVGKTVTVQSSPVPLTSVQIVSAALVNRQIQIQFAVVNPGSGSYSVQGAVDPAGPWSEEAAGAVQTVPGSANLAVLIAPGAGAYRFYRVVAR